MTLIEEIKNFAAGLPAEIKESKGLYDLSMVIAERKSFLNRQKLEYKAKFRIDEAGRGLKFTEMLKETSAGFSAGDTAGAGFQAESYSIKGKEREAGIEEQSTLFAKKYQYKVNYQAVRSKLAELAEKAGYRFEYQITAKGL
ncbi:MAG TPA: hypothetical protein VLH15_04115 [Dehalococcoidales bacterium]|nr:hypothetical protein [Dehalococcoidales bacterium]